MVASGRSPGDGRRGLSTARYVTGHDLIVDGGVTGNLLGRLPGIASITRS